MRSEIDTAGKGTTKMVLERYKTRGGFAQTMAIDIFWGDEAKLVAVLGIPPIKRERHRKLLDVMPLSS